MTLIVSIGRRVARPWYRRMASTVGGLITFQENIWQMIKSSLQMAKRKCNASGKGNWIIEEEKESEDLNYDIEWIKCMIQGNKAFEEEEYLEAQQLYKGLNKLPQLKKELPKDEKLRKQFKTKFLSMAKVDEAYKKGFGAVGDMSLSNKLLEMGILTHIELIEDWTSREQQFIS